MLTPIAYPRNPEEVLLWIDGAEDERKEHGGLLEAAQSIRETAAGVRVQARDYSRSSTIYASHMFRRAEYMDWCARMIEFGVFEPTTTEETTT